MFCNIAFKNLTTRCSRPLTPLRSVSGRLSFSVGRRTDCRGKTSILPIERKQNHERTKIRRRLAEDYRHAGRLPLPLYPLLRSRGVAFEEPGAERSSLRVDAWFDLALGHGALLPVIRSWYLVCAEIQARRGVYLGAGQAASHPSVYGGSLCPAAAPVLLRTAYQFGVSRQFLADHPALLCRLRATPYNAVARYSIAHSLLWTFVFSPVSLSDFADEPPTAALFEIRIGSALGRETRRMV